MKIYQLFLPAALIVLGGCASPAKVDQMIARDTSEQGLASEELRESIRVTSVIGGDKTNPLWTSEINSEDFRMALQDSLRAAGLLSRFKSKGAYELEASLREVRQPLFGFDLTVVTRVRYDLIDSVSRKTLFEDEITASHTATFSDAAYAVTRLRLANEGSARKNIEEFIRRLRVHQITP
jgi:hypothetical protein